MSSRARGPRPGTNVALLCLALAPTLTLVTNCTFPEYDFNPAGGAGGAGEGGTVAGGGSGAGTAASGGGAAGGTAAGNGGDAGEASAGEAGAGGTEPGCVTPTPAKHAMHCFNQQLDAGETAVDCGGDECPACSTAVGCLANSDCVTGVCSPSKTCKQILTLDYSPIDANAFTRGPKFNLTITYLDEADFIPLKSISIRYYFAHNGVSEPVLSLESQATIDPGGALVDISDKMSSRIYRLPAGPADQRGRKTDSYVEMTFSANSSLSNGGKLAVTQNVVASSADTPFDQQTHYSFTNGGGQSYQAITVYVDGKLVWGIEPPLTVHPDCAFVTGVNFAGPALQVDGLPIAAGADERISFDGNVFDEGEAKLVPAAEAATTQLVSSAFTFATDTVTWSVPNGKFWAYAWMTSADATDTGTLSIQDNPTDKFVGVQRGSGAGWSLSGPYPIDVLDNTLTLSATGMVHVAGLKLYRVLP